MRLLWSADQPVHRRMQVLGLMTAVPIDRPLGRDQLARMSWHARQRLERRRAQFLQQQGTLAARREREQRLALERRAREQDEIRARRLERARQQEVDGAAIRAQAQKVLDEMDRTPKEVAAAHLTELWLAVGGSEPEQVAS